MNAPEGIRRIATAIRWVGDGLGVMFAAGGVGFLIAAAVNYEWASDVVSVGIMLFVFGGLVSGAGRLASWIINGFAAPKATGE